MYWVLKATLDRMLNLFFYAFKSGYEMIILTFIKMTKSDIY